MGDEPSGQGTAAGTPSVSFLGRFGANYFRWYVWAVCFGLGFQIGFLAIAALKGRVVDGLVDFVAGIIGYALFGIAIALIPALISAGVPGFKVFPTTLGWGIIRVLIIGLALGLFVGVYGPAYQSR